MKAADYNEISKTYDSVRGADLRLINHILDSLPACEGLQILDIGCGTANYTDLVEKLTRSQDCQVYALEPSVGMLLKASQKNDRIEFKQGTAGQIPWNEGRFDFIYMTDVIHHVRDIGRMFAEVKRVLKPGGLVCIVTQSHPQIDARPIAKFFPATAMIDKNRYPDIEEIVQSAAGNALVCERQESFFEGEEIELGQEFLELVRLKGYSMLWLLSEKDYRRGLVALEEALRAGPINARMAGETLIWFSKK